MNITTGAPKMEVTVLIFSSRGAKAILAIRSHIIQKTAPPRNVPGMIISGLDVPKLLFIRNGTAIPTKEIGPAKAVTVADKILESKINATRKNLMFTPMLCA